MSRVASFGSPEREGVASASATTASNLTRFNVARVAPAGTAGGLEDSTLPLSLAGTDVDGTVTSVTIVSIPSGSSLSLADGTLVLAGQTITAAQATGLLFHPAADFNGNAAVAFTVTDDSGAVSAPASIGINVTAVNDAPVPSAVITGGGTGPEDTLLHVNLGGTDVDGTA